MKSKSNERLLFIIIIYYVFSQTVEHHQRLDIHSLVRLQQHIKVLHQSPVLQDLTEQRVLLLLHVKILEVGQLFLGAQLKVGGLWFLSHSSKQVGLVRV